LKAKLNELAVMRIRRQNIYI